MARPTTWRRSFDQAAGFVESGHLDLVGIAPGETLGATWWSYSLKSIGAVLANNLPPLANQTVLAGLILRDPALPVPSPTADAQADWLWWEEVGFDSILVNNIDFVYTNISTSGRDQRKIQAMRRNDTAGVLVLTACWATGGGSAGTGETAFRVNTAVSALVILPGP